jgi:1,4-dihydroxy-2-naphthoyl-CoA hydrolase
MSTNGPQDPAQPSLMMPFANALGIEVLSVSPEEVRGRLPWAPERCTSGDIMHGGALMAFADTLGAICAFANMQPGSNTSTIESKTNFFRAIRGGYANALTRPLHVGRTTVVVQTEISDDDGRRAALVIQTQAVLTPR